MRNGCGIHSFATKSGKCGALLLAALTLCLVAGCYERVSRGNESLYRFVWWLGPVVIAGGILGVPIGWLLRKWTPKWGFVLMFIAPVLLVIVAPAMYSDRVLIDDEHFEVRYGFWFAPSVFDLRFEDLSEIRYVVVHDARGRASYELHCLTNTGEVVVVHAGDLVRNTVPEILARAKARGVRVIAESV
jgi:hypothetical protein